MYTLMSRGGDIALSSTGDAEKLGGPEKIAHDLSVFLLSKVGHDRFHPWLGSSLDEFIGGAENALTLATVRQRVRAALEVYQANQNREIRRRLRYYDDSVVALADAAPSSLLARYERIEVFFDRENPGTIRIHIRFQTIAGQSGYTTVSLSPSDELLGLTGTPRTDTPLAGIPAAGVSV